MNAVRNPALNPAPNPAPNPGPRSIVGRLIAKDLYLYRGLVIGTLVAGVVSLVLMRFSAGDGVSTGPNFGFLLFLTTIIAFGVSIPMLVILKEHQVRSQLFVLSLPVSGAQYWSAKVLAALLAFLVPWIALTGGVVVVTALSGAPRGGIPFFVVMMTFLLSNFCVLLALVVVTLSELWGVVGILVTNVSVTVFIVRVGKLAGISERTGEAVATWSPALLAVLGAELALIALALGLAFYLPSRCRDFV